MNNIDIEIWKDIPGYEKYYQASNLGNIKSLDRIMYIEKRLRYLPLKGRILKPKKDKDGYLRVTLCINHKLKYYRVHQLIAKTFLKNPNNYLEVNHKNFIKDDNNVNNLEWCNGQMNKFHRWKEKSGISNLHENINYEEMDFSLSELRSNKLTIEKVIKIRDLYNSKKYTQQEIADIFEISGQRVSSIVNFKSWNF